MKTRKLLRWLVGVVLLMPISFVRGQEPTQPPSYVSIPQTTNAPSPAKTYQSPWFVELSKLGEAGIGEGVMLAFVDSAGTFNLNPEEIIRLRDAGVSTEVISAVLKHDSEIAQGLRQVTTSTVPGSLPLLTGLLAKGPALSPETNVPPAALATDKAGEPPPQRPGDVLVAANDQPEPDIAPAGFVQTTDGPVELSPVRKPYAERITSPILVFRSAGRTPNRVIIEMFP